MPPDSASRDGSVPGDICSGIKLILVIIEQCPSLQSVRFNECRFPVEQLPGADQSEVTRVCHHVILRVDLQMQVGTKNSDEKQCQALEKIPASFLGVRFQIHRLFVLSNLEVNGGTGRRRCGSNNCGANFLG